MTFTNTEFAVSGLSGVATTTDGTDGTTSSNACGAGSETPAPKSPAIASCEASGGIAAPDTTSTDVPVDGGSRFPSTAFTDTLFGHVSLGHVELRAFSKDQPPLREWFHVDEAEGVLERAEKLARDRDVYVGVGLRRDTSGGSKANVAALAVLWADLDCTDGKHKTGMCGMSRVEALAFLDKLDHPPTLVVDSGGGLHAYWRLTDPIVLGDGNEQKLAESLLRRLATAVHGDPSVAEVARIMRVPGTFNHKTDPPRPVALVRYVPEREYDPRDLEQALPPDPTSNVRRLRTRRSPEHEERHAHQRQQREGRIVTDLYLPCMRNLARGAGWQEGEGHTIRLRAASHLKHYGMPEESLPALIVNLDTTIEESAAAAHDLSGVVRSVFHGRGGDGYNSLGCDDPLWTADGRRCGDAERAVCPVWRSRDDESEDRAAVREAERAMDAIAENVDGKALLLLLAPVYDAVAAVSSPTLREAGMSDIVERFGERCAALKKSTVKKEVKRRVIARRMSDGGGARSGDDDLIIPADWRIQGTRLQQVRYDRDGEVDGFDTVTDRVPILVGRYRDVETDDRALECEFSDPPGTALVAAPRDDWMSASGLTRLARHGLPVHAQNARRLTTWIDAMETANAERLPYAESIHRFGWHGDHFVLGNDVLGPEGGPRFIPSDAGERQMVDALAPGGTFEGWCETVLSLALRYPKLLVCVVAAHAPVLMGAVSARSIVLELVGHTSSGKTTAANAGMSAWGNPESGENAEGGLSRTFNTTQVGVERYLTLLGGGLPVLLDDSQNATRREQVPAIIYMVGNGVAKMRGSKAGTQHTGSWRTVAFVTGESSVEETSPYAGVGARILTIHDPFSGNQRDDVEALTRCTAQHHGHSGRAFVHWLLDRSNWEQEAKHGFETWRQQLAAALPDNSLMSRKVKYLATLMVTAEMLQQAFPWPLTDSATLTDVLLEHLIEWAESQPIPDQAQASFDSFVSWCSERRNEFWDPVDARRDEPVTDERGRRIGIWDGRNRTVSLLTAAASRWEQESGFPLVTSARQWADRGWLRAGDGKNLTRRVTLHGTRPRAYQIVLPDGELA